MTYLQIPQSVDIFDNVLKLGGVLSVLLLIGLITVWRKYQTAIKDIALLNKSIQTDAMQNIKIIDAAMNTMDNKYEINEDILKKTDEILDIIKNKKVTVS